MALACPCCHCLTLQDSPPGTFDDPVQFPDPNYQAGANHPSLNEARENFRNLKVSDASLRHLARAPTEDELPIDLERYPPYRVASPRKRLVQTRFRSETADAQQFVATNSWTASTPHVRHGRFTLTWRHCSTLADHPGLNQHSRLQPHRLAPASVPARKRVFSVPTFDYVCGQE